LTPVVGVSAAPANRTDPPGPTVAALASVVELPMSTPTTVCVAN
jgi:hypothetical protein